MAAKRPDLRTAATAIGTELTFVLLAFFVALLLVSALPLRPVIDTLARHAFGPPSVAPDVWRLVVGILLTPLTTLLAAYLHRGLTRLLPEPEPEPVLPPPAPLLASAGQVLLHLLLAVLGSYVIAILMHVLGAPVAEQQLVVEISRAPLGPEIGLLAVSAVLLAPLAEELLFRDRLFRRVAERTGLAPAYATSALLFAAVHLNLQGFVVYAWLAVVFARVYMVTGRLGAAVAVHLGNNAITLAALVLAPEVTTPGP